MNFEKTKIPFSFSLEKWVWTDKDFEIMGWHDATIYASRLEGDLTFDIDYIFKWNPPELENFYFTYFVAPCTLTFRDVKDLSFEISPISYQSYIEIDYINLIKENSSQLFTINTHHGFISFYASGYTQTVRMEPSFQLSQIIPFDERGGTSFETYVDIKLDPDVQKRVQERKEKDYEVYCLAKERFLLKKEMEALQRRREANEIELKAYIKEKNYLKQKLENYTKLLEGSRYEPNYFI